MSTSANDESSEAEAPGEILKASSPGPAQLEIGMGVRSLDGEPVGTVKEIHSDEFLVNRPWARDLWVPFSAKLAQTVEQISVSGNLSWYFRGCPCLFLGM